MAPQTHPQAQFVPISPDFDLHALVDNANNFDYVTRLSTEKLKEHSIQSFEALVLSVVVQSGQPLVIEDWGESLPPWLFNSTWLQENLGSKPEQVRDIPNEVNIPMSIGHYLRSMGTLTNRITSTSYKDPKRQRLYLKDIDCPKAWADHLKAVMPESVYYLNDCIEPRTGGDGAIREPNEYGQMVYGKGVAPAGDLMCFLPPEMRAENMMCYIGHEGTYTPAHREMCASLGHNIMVEASEDRNGERSGSSIWFMTETKEREVVSEYFLSMLGHDIEVERHFAQVNAWKKAPFNVWVVEQKVGDLILIPPMAPHQVWNRGTRTMKAAWNRTTVDTLELAIHEALPRARMVCREEQYKNKAIIYYTLLHYNEMLQRDTVEPKMWKYGRIKQVLDDFKRLFALYTEVLVSEMFSLKLAEEEDVEFLQYDSNVTCSYCRGNIFNRFLTCKCCILVAPNGDEDTYDICMDCYAMGRSCACISGLKWVEQWNWQTLVGRYEEWRGTVVQSDGFFDVMRSPQPLDVARKRYGKKPVAEVCQEQLRLRPWNDITKEADPQDLSPEVSEEEPEVDDEGRIKKRKRSKRGKSSRRKTLPLKNKTHSCHICFHHHWNWKQAFCTTCSQSYCYGVLWRAFDLMPQTVMEDKEWSCPRCLKICSCSKCRKTPSQKAYAPKGTLLGHDTRKVADYRSVESLVDFSRTNLLWLRENDPSTNESARMKRLKDKAEAEKSRVDPVDDSYFEGVAPTSFMSDNADHVAQYSANQEIDPFLLEGDNPSENGAELSDHQNNLLMSFDSTVDGGNHFAANTTDDHSNSDWIGLNGQNKPGEFQSNNSYSQNAANYPSGLTAPVAPMLAAQPSYPDPLHVGQARMMGAGFYQQGTGVDRILFDAPVENGSAEDVAQPNEARNPNFEFSDLLDPLLQPEVVKKRKRIGEGDEDNEDDEFYTSKRQKRLAQSKKAKQEPTEDESTTQQVPRVERHHRRGAGASQSYIDLGEEAVPIEDDEGSSAVSSHIQKQKPHNAESDMELAAQALSRLSKPRASSNTPVSGRRRGRPRKGDNLHSVSLSAPPASNTIKTPRRSAWLARKAAVELGEESQPNSLHRSQQPRRRRESKLGTSIHISSESDDDDAGVAVEEETDSLFGEPIEKNQPPVSEDDAQEQVFNEAPESNSVLQLTDRESPGVAETYSKQVNTPTSLAVLTPRPRGRPRKNPLPNSNNATKLIATRGPPTVKGLLSLKEKLALKGKSFKIVASKPKAVIGVTTSPRTSIRSPMISTNFSPKPTSKASPTSSESEVGNTARVISSGSALILSSPTPSEPDSNDTPILPTTSAPAESFRKGPTVVRLLSSEPEDDFSTFLSNNYAGSHETSSSSDDSESSIPAVRVSPKMSRRGGSVRGNGTTRGRGRGRPRIK